MPEGGKKIKSEGEINHDKERARERERERGIKIENKRIQ